MRELFVYYRIAASDAAALRIAVREFQSRLMQRFPALQARLLVRPMADDPEGATTGRQTWMETYATDPRHRPGGIDPDLQAAIETEAAVLAPWLIGPRHIEVFQACA